MRESEIERYLVKRVKEHGGEARKIRYIGRRHATDRMVIFPWGRVYFIELKAPDKTPRAGQEREHQRLRDMGFQVFTLDTKEKVDTFISFSYRPGHNKQTVGDGA